MLRHFRKVVYPLFFIKLKCYICVIFSYLSGGNATGLNHQVVTDFTNFEPKLFQCKGKRNVRCTQVKLVKESLNLGDVFILDRGSEIFVWMPPESGRLERIKVRF